MAVSERAQRGARVGAAVLAAGLWAAGPQMIGVAAADTGVSDTAGAGESRGGAERSGRSGSEPRAARRAAERRAVAEDGAAAAGERGAVRRLPAPRDEPAAKPGPAAGTSSVEVPTATSQPRSPQLTEPAPRGPSRARMARPVPEPAATVPTAPAEVSSVLRVPPALRAAQTASPAIPATFGEAIAAIRETIQINQATLFNTLANLLTDLPQNDITRFLEGALLLVRQRFFNQAPRITQSTPYTSSDGTIRGRIGAADLEGDALTFSVVADPNFGTVTLGADGLYVYTPGPDYAGSDAFLVEVSTAPVLNLLTPFADNDSRVVEVQIGAPRPTAPFLGSNAAGQGELADDVVVYLPDVSGRITIRKSGWLSPYTAVVTLVDVDPETRVAWMDSTGDRGEVSVTEAVQLWPSFQTKAVQSGGSVDLGVLFSADDGSASALLLSGVDMSVDADGQYVFTGQLSPNSAERPDAVDRWDVIGRGYKAQYENFRAAYGIVDGLTGPATVNVDFRNAAVVADTASPVSYLHYGLYALDNRQADIPDGPTLATATLAADQVGAAVAESATSGVTASIPLEQSFVIGREDGTVELWTGGRKQILQTAVGQGGVVEILAYDRPLQDADGNIVAASFTGSIEGDVLTVTALGAGSTVVVGEQITGLGVEPGTVIVEFLVPETARCIEQSGDNCTRYTGGQGGTDGGLGTYRVSTPQTVTSAIITQPSTVATAPGFIVGMGNGTVRLWSATNGWVELQSGFSGGITAMATYRDGIVVGLDDGSVEQWRGPTGQGSETWKNNWNTLRAKGAGQSVTEIVTAADGVVVGLTTQVIFLREPTPWAIEGFLMQEPNPSAHRVTAMTTYANGVAVGYDEGAVLYWDLRDPAATATVLDSGFGRAVTTMVPYVRNPDITERSLIVGYTTSFRGTGAALVRKYASDSASDYKQGNWKTLHDDGWASSVTRMTTFSSAAISNRAGVIVGLANGSLQLWNGNLSSFDANPGQRYWTELHDPGWGSAVASLIPLSQYLPDSQGNVVPRDGVVAGLANGSVQQWSGRITGTTGQGDWTQIVCAPTGCGGPAPKPDPSPSLDKEGTLRQAVEFAKKAQKAGADWGKANNVGGEGDPLFWGTNLLPPCKKSNSCDGQFLPIAVVVEKSPLEKEWKTLDASVKLSYDVNGIAYGYAFMPNGFWDKLRPGKWSLAAMAAIETGPALTVSLGEGGTINAPRSTLLKWDYSTPGPLGVDRIALGLGIDGELSAQLACGDSDCPKELFNAHAYFVPGVLVTYNTQAKPGGVGIGYNWYPDLEFGDFSKVTGATISATLTPYATLSYGIFTPDEWWFIGGWSLFKLGVGYENPVTATLVAQQGSDVSMTIGTQGFLTTRAGILESLTSKLTWNNTFQVFDEPNLVKVL